MGRVTLEKLPKVSQSARLTYEQFLAGDFENPHVEWIDGKVVEMAPIGDAHADVGGLLEAVMRAFAEEKKLGIVRHDPFQMKTGPGLPGRAPDIFFLAKNHLKQLRKTHLAGPADLVVEIISPDSRGRDRGEKFYEYEKGGVPEYWLIDPQRKQIEIYLRDKGGIYRMMPPDGEGIYHSTELAGFWIDPKWLWQTPLPPMFWVLEQLGVR